MGTRCFRKRPVVVEAIEWTGSNEAEIQEWISWPGANGPGGRFFNALDDEDRANCGDPAATAQVFDKLHSTWVLVFTGQWIIRGVQGELFAGSVLDETYEPVDGDDRSDRAKVAEGLAIFGRYGAGDVHAEHDELYAGPDPVNVSDGDRSRLKALGWHPGEDCFRIFV